MNAKEWFNKEIGVGELNNTVSSLMERYSSYKEEELRFKIFQFRNVIKNVDVSIGSSIITEQGVLLKDYFDEHFNIEKL